HRRPRVGDRLRTTATIIAIEPRRPGAYVVTRFETCDADGLPVTTTDYGSIYRGVGCDDEAAVSPPESARPGRSAIATAPDSGSRVPDWSGTVLIGAPLAHVYTECARIWNPVHTDRAAARKAGLPDIILHGTATLALAVSKIVDREGLGAGAPITRIGCRFRGMVRLPSAITVMGWKGARSDHERVIAFQAPTPDAHAAVTA